MDGAGSILLLLISLGVLALYIVFWFRTWQDIQRADLDASSRGMWTLAILVFQFFGPLAWWWAGPGTRHRS